MPLLSFNIVPWFPNSPQVHNKINNNSNNGVAEEIELGERENFILDSSILHCCNNSMLWFIKLSILFWCSSVLSWHMPFVSLTFHLLFGSISRNHYFKRYWYRSEGLYILLEPIVEQSIIVNRQWPLFI